MYARPEIRWERWFDQRSSKEILGSASGRAGADRVGSSASSNRRRARGRRDCRADSDDLHAGFRGRRTLGGATITACGRCNPLHLWGWLRSGLAQLAPQNRRASGRSYWCKGLAARLPTGARAQFPDAGGGHRLGVPLSSFSRCRFRQDRDRRRFFGRRSRHSNVDRPSHFGTAATWRCGRDLALGRSDLQWRHHGQQSCSRHRMYSTRIAGDGRLVSRQGQPAQPHCFAGFCRPDWLPAIFLRCWQRRGAS